MAIHRLHNLKLPSIPSSLSPYPNLPSIPSSLSPYPKLPKFRKSITIRCTIPITAHTSLSTGADSSPLYVYIVHVRRPDNVLRSDMDSLQKYYLSFLPQTELDSSSSPRLLYSYSESMSGFAAHLTEEEVSAMSSIPGFLLAHRSRNYHLMTTRNPTSSASVPKPDSGANPMEAKTLSSECSAPLKHNPDSSILQEE